MTDTAFINTLSQFWQKSKAFRIALILATVYALLRLLSQVLLIASLWLPDAPAEAIPNDLRDYLNAANAIQTQSDLYPSEIERWEFYQYAPSFALIFTSFTLFSPRIAVVIHTALHIIAYMLLFKQWDQIFQSLQLGSLRKRLVWSTPLWLIFAAFWADLGYLNIYIIIALLATFLIKSVLDERLFPSLLWASIILQIKPHWAFAIAVPLILGRHRFFFKLVLGCVAGYISIVGVSILIMGPQYGWQQHQDYFSLLVHLVGQNHPWRTAADNFLGYNHSITQIVVFLFGNTNSAHRLSVITRLLLLAPLGLLGLRHARFASSVPLRYRPLPSLSFAFCLYLGAFIWLDAVWELSLGLIVFIFLYEASSKQQVMNLLWLTFLPYALTDCWQLLSLLFFGPDIVAPGFYVLSDPNIYVPLIMIVILVFYGVLIHRLWSLSTDPVKSGVNP